MGYRLGNQEIDLASLKKLNFVPSTKAGDVYRYKNMAIRVFKEGEEPIPKETAEYFTGVSTDRILLPRKLLFYNEAFKGYGMKLVSQKGAGKRIITTPKKELVDCVEVLERDIDTLSHRNVLLNGINPGYTLYNGELFLVNPAGYSILEIADVRKLERLNQYQLHLLITELIAADLRKSRVPQPTINVVKKVLSLKDMDQKSSDYLSEVMRGQINIKELVKKIG